ncbi:hypothetical protein EB796_000741 [Bugula neritina]|uniref:Uncharacterized protein n=1 Tax=Bugula neritina TaxID=10212 RepID=A0A7J7KRS8_BUGNE|nr:hypothetical protein EB796_000741 [Bugula neritina]
MYIDFSYLENFCKETLRFSRLAPFAARVSSHDSLLGGHVIPKNTPIITSIGTLLSDKNLWKDPETFNPDRFNERPPPYAFEPFGFAGKRKCPGYRLSEIEANIFLVLTIKQFKVALVPGQVVKNLYGLVTKPADEIWLTVEERK